MNSCLRTSPVKQIKRNRAIRVADTMFRHRFYDVPRADRSEHFGAVHRFRVPPTERLLDSGGSVYLDGRTAESESETPVRR